jgi:FtsP/CotA-like multicopper oxidase with cupredoxin domain
MAYQRSIPGPTLHVRPGDQLDVALVNSLGGDLTNLHVHGMHVSPRDNGDNVFIHVMNGQTFDYSYAIPANHPPGLYWYHPHNHGDSWPQVEAGLGGAIIVEGGLDDLPEIAGLTTRLLVLQGPVLDASHQAQYLVNGQVNPEIPIRPGETQRWRILNATANNFFNLQLVRHQLHEIATDGNPRPEVATVDTLILAPAERTEVLVQGGPAGIYEFRSIAWAEDIPSQAQPEFLVATLVSGGAAMETAPLPTTLIDREDLSTLPVDRQRTIVFQENASPPVFAIDGKAFEEDRVDQTVQLNALEEWILRNDSPEWHPFHIHVNDFQVISRNGRPEPRTYEDTSRIPPRGELVIRTRFLDFTGKFVYHCHILGHEDAGMMGVVEVVE